MVKFVLLLTFILSFMNRAAGGEENMEKMNLPGPKLKGDVSVEETIARRRSVRSYSSRKLRDQEISQLLWACQGTTGTGRFRAAPSAGALYPLEVYLVKDDGIFLYIPEKHRLEKKSGKNAKGDLAKAAWGQAFINEAPVNIVICAVYERVTSRYGERGIRYTDIEVGHAAENVHLQAVSLGLGSCPVGAFNDSAVTKILNLSKNEKPIYIIPIGYGE